MKKVLCVFWAGAFAAACVCQAKPVAMDAAVWEADPLFWQTDGRALTPAGSNLTSFVETRLPRSSRAVFSARFRAGSIEGESWATAGLALMNDAQNFWHLSLVRSPLQASGKHSFELAEMRNGVWSRQSELKTVFSRVSGAWREGEDCLLSLALDPEGIEGTIRDAAGKELFAARYLFTGPAVRTGRPALHVTGGFLGAFSAADAETSGPVAEAPAFPPYASGATGFFRVRQDPDGRWWVIDPAGRRTFLMGVDHVKLGGHYCEKLGYSPYDRKNRAKYASKADWEAESLARLKAWGFNSLGAGCDTALWHRGLAHTVFLSFGDKLAYSSEPFYITPNENRPCSAFPNVFHPRFQASCEYQARRLCAPNRNDPWLFGYFIDNELAWWGRGDGATGLFDAVMKLPASHTAKTALRDFLVARAGGDLAALNACWGTKLARADDLLALGSLPSKTPEQTAAKLDFLRLVAERYFSVSAAAIRAADPNHLVLGARFAGIGGAHPAVWEIAGKHCDLVTFNCYPWADLDRNTVFMDRGKSAERAADAFAELYRLVKRPMLVTEWSFPALDSGLPCLHGAGQRFRTQAERTAATSLFARTMLSLPFLIGYDYFMWVDEPALGMTTAFPEDSNYGLINEDGVPYPALTSMFAALQKDAAAWHLRPIPAATPAPSAASALISLPAPEPGAKPVALTRAGDSFRAEAPNGLVLAGRIGGRNLVDSITLGGRDLGSYNAMLRIEGPVWLDSGRLVAAETRLDAQGRAVLELTGAGRGFEVTHRLTVSTGPAPAILCEFVRAVNTGNTPLALRSCYFRLHAPFNDVAPGQVPHLWRAPRGAAWLENRDGRYIGFAANADSDADLFFWVGPAGDAHPDASFAAPAKLAPGATYRPAAPMQLLCLPGTDGKTGWEAAQGRLAK